MAWDASRLRKRITWLNTAGGFDNQLVYSTIAEEAAGLPDAKVMDILKRLEDNYEKVWDPMRWVLSSIDKAHWASEGLDEALDAMLRRRIRWLNSEGGFESRLSYAKVSEAAVGVDGRRLMNVLRFLEERWEWVDDPTAWVCTALRKALQSHSGGGVDAAGGWASWADDWAGAWGGAWDGSWGGAPDGGKGWGMSQKGGSGFGVEDQAAFEDFYGKLWRRIMWLNTKGGFDGKIEYPNIAEIAEFANKDKVFELLQYLEDHWDEVKNPTAWVCTALRKAGSATYPAHDSYEVWGGESYTLEDDKDRRLRTRIRWLNNEGGFENRILYDTIAEAAWDSEIGWVMEVLKNLEDRWESIDDPNSWVVAQLRHGRGGKAAKGGSTGGKGGGKAGKGGGRAGRAGGLGGDAWWSGIGGGDDEDWEKAFDRKLRSRVRWLNNEGGFENRLIYAKVAEAAADVPAARVFTALRYLEDKGKEQVEDPTSWVCAGLVKAKRQAAQ